MESNPGMKLGWSPLHEACFVANKPVVIKLLNYSKESGKNLIELETSDEYSGPFLFHSKIQKNSFYYFKILKKQLL